jgi:hypothetical protein
VTAAALVRGLAAVSLVVAAVLQVAPGRSSRNVEQELRAALAAKGPGYVPRTRHRLPDGSPEYTNRLLLEPSPYLQQHAHNPVDWYPWGPEAFEKARRENKQILLSVGYSTCHWCHVMEEESFEDEEIAAYLNQHYVAVKVDREQRPDVDSVYMAAVQIMHGSGGWPMTVWLTPELEPFYGGTYFPPRAGARGARLGFLEMLQRLQEAWTQNHHQATAAAKDVVERLQTAAPAAGDLPDAAPLRAAYAESVEAFDETAGGFGDAPKFPRTATLELLLRYHRRTGDPKARAMVELTLERMAAGGIHDQVGGGFHRYSTDRQWLVPHFEKMLYDNALLAIAYLEAYQLTGRTDFADVARRTLDYARREMTDPAGAFWSATDADSEGKEGTFFLWTPDELRMALDPRRSCVGCGRGAAPLAVREETAASTTLATAYWGVTPEGNFEGETILHVARPLAEVAAAQGLDDAEAAAMLERTRARLYKARAKRVPPHTDRKILPSWNGLMISALARGAMVLDQPAYVRAASRAADFVLGRMRQDGRLRRSALGEEISGDGYVDDYVYMVAGLLDLFEATGEIRWLADAVALQEVLDARFADPAGGYFTTADDQERLLVRDKPDYDGALPAANSVAARNLLRLAELTGDDRHRAAADATLKAFAPVMTRAPGAVPYLLTALDFRHDLAKEIVIVTPPGGDAGPLRRGVHAAFVPNKVVIEVEEGPKLDALSTLVPLVAEKKAQGGQPTAYVCERGVCQLPTSDPDEVGRQLAKVTPLP